MTDDGPLLDRKNIKTAHHARVETVIQRADRKPFNGNGVLTDFCVRHVVMFRDRFTCQLCGAMWPEVELSVDHIHEMRNGGDRTDLANMWTLCSRCHIRKTLLYDDYMWRQFPDSEFLQSRPLRKRYQEAVTVANEKDWP